MYTNMHHRYVHVCTCAHVYAHTQKIKKTGISGRIKYNGTAGTQEEKGSEPSYRRRESTLSKARRATDRPL